jgi:hypothetical protein
MRRWSKDKTEQQLNQDAELSDKNVSTASCAMPRAKFPHAQSGAP